MRIRRRLAFFIMALTTVTLTTVPAAFAVDSSRDLTRGKCKGCHAEGSSAGTMTPLSKTQRQWQRFFEKEQHEKKAPGNWKEITPAELERIRQYLIEHAADSPHPETCG